MNSSGEGTRCVQGAGCAAPWVGELLLQEKVIPWVLVYIVLKKKAWGPSGLRSLAEQAESTLGLKAGLGFRASTAAGQWGAGSLGKCTPVLTQLEMGLTQSYLFSSTLNSPLRNALPYGPVPHLMYGRTLQWSSCLLLEVTGVGLVYGADELLWRYPGNQAPRAAWNASEPVSSTL